MGELCPVVKKQLKTKNLCPVTTTKLLNDLLKRHIIMDLNLRNRDLKQNKNIENLFNIIRPVGDSSHYLQQACMSNLLVTVFATRRQESLLVLKTFLPLIE
jgi:hypothetical protein